MFDFIQGAAAAVLDRKESVTFWCEDGNLVTQVGYQKHSTPIADASSFERGCAVGANLANAYREQTVSIRAASTAKREAAPAEKDPTGAAGDVRCRTPRVAGLNIATSEQPGERNNSASHTMNARAFRRDLESLVNRHSLENGSDTPDFVLAEFLSAALKAFDRAVNVRSGWCRRHDKPGANRGDPLSPSEVVPTTSAMTGPERNERCEASYTHPPSALPKTCPCCHELAATHAQLRASLAREQQHIRDRQELERKLATVRLAVAPDDDGPACAGRDHDRTARRT